MDQAPPRMSGPTTPEMPKHVTPKSFKLMTNRQENTSRRNEVSHFFWPLFLLFDVRGFNAKYVSLLCRLGSLLKPDVSSIQHIPLTQVRMTHKAPPENPYTGKRVPCLLRCPPKARVQRQARTRHPGPEEMSIATKSSLHLSRTKGKIEIHSSGRAKPALVEKGEPSWTLRNMIPDPPKVTIHPFSAYPGIGTAKVLVLAATIHNHKVPMVKPTRALPEQDRSFQERGWSQAQRYNELRIAALPKKILLVAAPTYTRPRTSVGVQIRARCHLPFRTPGCSEKCNGPPQTSAQLPRARSGLRYHRPIRIWGATSRNYRPCSAAP